MNTTEIPRRDWARFIEAASGGLSGAEVSIEIQADRTRRDEWLLLRGIAYEIGTETIWIHTDRIEHEIVRPTRLRAVEDGGRLERLEVDGANANWVLRFRVPVPNP